MSKYKGLFTFDEDNHRYVPTAQADGIIDTMDYEPDSKPAEPLIKDEKIRKAVRAWAEANKFSIFIVNVKHSNTFEIKGLEDIGDAHGCSIYFKGTISKANNITYTIAELCGEGEE